MCSKIPYYPNNEKNYLSKFNNDFKFSFENIKGVIKRIYHPFSFYEGLFKFLESTSFGFCIKCYSQVMLEPGFTNKYSDEAKNFVDNYFLKYFGKELYISMESLNKKLKQKKIKFNVRLKDIKEIGDYYKALYNDELVQKPEKLKMFEHMIWEDILKKYNL